MSLCASAVRLHRREATVGRLPHTRLTAASGAAPRTKPNLSCDLFGRACGVLRGAGWLARTGFVCCNLGPPDVTACLLLAMASTRGRALLHPETPSAATPLPPSAGRRAATAPSRGAHSRCATRAATAAARAPRSAGRSCRASSGGAARSRRARWRRGSCIDLVQAADEVVEGLAHVALD